MITAFETATKMFNNVLETTIKNGEHEKMLERFDEAEYYGTFKLEYSYEPFEMTADVIKAFFKEHFNADYATSLIKEFVKEKLEFNDEEKSSIDDIQYLQIVAEDFNDFIKDTFDYYMLLVENYHKSLRRAYRFN
jgi:hypothetical protein